MDNKIINAFCRADIERQSKLYRAEFNAIGLKYNIVPTPFYTMEQGHAIEGTIDFVLLIEKYYKIVAQFENHLRALYDHYKDIDRAKANAAQWANNVCVRYHDINPPQVATLPDWAQSTEGAQILNKLAEAGYCSHVGQLYQWSNTKSLWAFFADVVSDVLKLRKSNRVPWLLIASAFDNINTDDIETAKTFNSSRKQGYANMPVGWEQIEAIVTNK